jgi:hypothetical protein
MRDELVGYIVGALDEEARHEVEAHLPTDPKLQAELDLLRESVKPLDADRQHDDPPQGLAARTCEYVFQREAVQLAAASVTEPAPLAPIFEETTTAATRRWSMADVAVAAGIFIAAGLLLFPAISHGKFNAEVTACQNNLQEIGSAVHQYSERDPSGRIPAIPQTGELAVAGLYAPQLVEAGFVSDPRVFFCGTSAADDGEQTVEIPKYSRLVTLARQKDKQLKSMLVNVGGSYAYNLGYYDGAAYRTLSFNDSGDSVIVLMADSPCPQSGYSRSRNHGGYGQNVLFLDGGTEYLTGCRTPGCSDADFYHNDDGQVAAGKHRRDSVVGGCLAKPCK